MTWVLAEATEDDVTITRDGDTSFTLRFTELDALIRTLYRSKTEVLELRREARKTGRCEYCGGEFARKPGPGRPRIHCTDVCRRAMSRKVYKPAWEARKIRREQGRNRFI